MRELENVDRAAGRDRARREIALPDDLPPEVRAAAVRRLRPQRERRRTVADELYKKLVDDRRVVLDRRSTRCTCSARSRASNVRDLVTKGLQEARGNYKIVARLFNMEPRDYKRFLNFLRKHDCQLPFKEFR